MQLKQKISDFEDRFIDLNKDLQRLNSGLQEKQKELETFRNKYNNFEAGRNNDMEELKKELNHYRSLVYVSLKIF